MTVTLAIPTTVEEPLLECGDALELMRRLPADSIDAVVDDQPAGIGFMGKAWDSFRHYRARTREGQVRLDTLSLLGLKPWEAGFVAFTYEAHVEALRVLKPGAYMVTWALPKTADLAGLALRLAGFELVHQALHLFGGGFPKSHNVSKALDKAAGAEREVVGTRVTGSQGSRGDKLNAGDGWEVGHKVIPVTAHTTDAAKRWDGYHTQLAPGHEVWHVSRKPTPLTYAANVLEHGCGAMNIGATRIPRGDKAKFPEGVVSDTEQVFGGGTGMHGDRPRGGDSNPGGSWPRDVLLTQGGDQCPVEGIDRQSGVLTPHGKTTWRGASSGEQATYGDYGATTASAIHQDSGGASRYFTRFESRVRYGPKNSDRRKGLLHGDHKHPTPKHPDLMAWLQKLVTPTAKATGGLPGVVLSRFLGSGTDGVAAVRNGFRFVGFELDPKHFEVARSKIMAAIGSPEAAAEANEQAPTGAQLGLL